MAEKEYIERGVAIETLRKALDYCDDKLDIGEFKNGCIGAIRDNIVDIGRVPAADVVEVRHGEWGKEKWMHTDQHICSLCHSTVRVHPQSVEYRYCPYCGAKMDGERKE